VTIDTDGKSISGSMSMDKRRNETRPIKTMPTNTMKVVTGR